MVTHIHTHTGAVSSLGPNFPPTHTHLICSPTDHSIRIVCVCVCRTLAGKVGKAKAALAALEAEERRLRDSPSPLESLTDSNGQTVSVLPDFEDEVLDTLHKEAISEEGEGFGGVGEEDALADEGGLTGVCSHMCTPTHDTHTHTHTRTHTHRHKRDRSNWMTRACPHRWRDRPTARIEL